MASPFLEEMAVGSKAVFLDRDGIINATIVEGNGCLRSPRNIKEFSLIDGVAEFLTELKSLGYLTIVVTNQPDIARGKLSKQDFDAMEDMVLQLPVDWVYCCPHDDNQCTCRKPSPNLLFIAAKKHNLDLSQCFMFGDSWKDMIAGKAAGCKTLLLYKSYNWNDKKFADIVVVNFQDALDSIKGGG